MLANSAAAAVIPVGSYIKSNNLIIGTMINNKTTASAAKATIIPIAIPFRQSSLLGL